jgi:hypothetical protein
MYSRTALAVGWASTRRRQLDRFTACVLAAVALSAGFAGPSTAAAAAAASPIAPAVAADAIGLRLLDVPAAEASDPRARLYIVDRLTPGTIIHRRVEVSNTTAEIAHVSLYPAAASIAGGTFLGAVAHTPNELSGWTSVSPPVVDIPAGSTATATVTIAVPRRASTGERYGAVWAETRSTHTAGSGVMQVSRVGIRLYLAVDSGTDPDPATGFSIDSLTAERSPEGQPMVLATVRNTGGRALDIYGMLQLSAGPAGLSAGPFAVTLGTTVAIGDTEPVSITLDSQLPTGPWDARITLHSGLLVHSARATITFPATGAAQAVPTTGSHGRHRWLYLALSASLIVLSLAAAVGTSLWRRRHRPATP